MDVQSQDDQLDPTCERESRIFVQIARHDVYKMIKYSICFTALLTLYH